MEFSVKSWATNFVAPLRRSDVISSTPTTHAQYISGFPTFILSGTDQATAQAWLPAHGFAFRHLEWPGAVIAGCVAFTRASQEPFCSARAAIGASDSWIERNWPGNYCRHRFR